MTQYKFDRLRPEYQKLWSEMTVTKEAAATAQARKVIASKAKYKAVEAETTVPWFVVGCLHMRESNGNFNTYLGNGQPLDRVTTIVPKGRGPFPSFLAGAVDAISIEGLDKIRDWGPEHVAYACEKFNGFGYRSPARDIPSPYLWGGTSVQERGKFVSDGVYDPNTMDPQIGAMAVLKQIMALDPEARFKQSAPPEAPQAQPSTPLSPRADDTEAEVKPLVKSKGIWGGILTWLTANGGIFAGLFDKLATKEGLIIFFTILVLSSIGLFLVIKGRIDVQAIMKHLSNADEGADK